MKQFEKAGKEFLQEIPRFDDSVKYRKEDLAERLMVYEAYESMTDQEQLEIMMATEKREREYKEKIKRAYEEIVGNEYHDEHLFPINPYLQMEEILKKIVEIQPPF